MLRMLQREVIKGLGVPGARIMTFFKVGNLENIKQIMLLLAQCRY